MCFPPCFTTQIADFFRKKMTSITKANRYSNGYNFIANIWPRSFRILPLVAFSPIFHRDFAPPHRRHRRHFHHLNALVEPLLLQEEYYQPFWKAESTQQISGKHGSLTSITTLKDRCVRLSYSVFNSWCSPGRLIPTSASNIFVVFHHPFLLILPLFVLVIYLFSTLRNTLRSETMQHISFYS